ncbi:protein TMEPAI isoform X2 [Corythoichthys intestinalis]|uniref:protein TMEPAI isoform X2 n=1 Tax=Corythoichthys intestinalis TaxID=161448 RepID=UPI0025A60DD4|nr:protein TMEPAI isoform X2 [Corythoichthys intestinalis]
MHPSTGTHNHDICVETQTCAQLELVQMVVIVVVMLVMVVVITCVLNRYRMSAHSLRSRRALPPGSRSHLHLEAGLWSSDVPSSVPRRLPQGCPPPAAPNRIQPTFPFLRRDLIMDLPHTISLSDGEEPPPYQGPCTLQLRDPEQQMELNRESVRPPPNRTVFDSLDPSTPYVSLQATRLNKKEGAPPTYNEVIGHHYHPGSSEMDSRKTRNTKEKS